ncbi:MAG: MerR family transcriptional regulator [Myxococcales bacterium]|nr:MAG: MerR family transcriptional regulator [Myxococcales bacterium]
MLDENEGLYPMRVVARLTGLSADTVRVWERRYQAVTPERTDGGARRYSASEVRRLILMREATEQGHPIRKIARLGETELKQLQEQALGPEPAHEAQYSVIYDYLNAVRRFEGVEAMKLLGRSAAFFSARDTVFSVVIPLLHRVGKEWSEGRFSIAQEHLVSQQLGSVLCTMLRQFSPHPGAPKIIFAGPEKHFHTFGALIGAFIAASRGIEPVFLGADVPFSELEDVVKKSGAEVVVLSMLRMLPDEERDRTLNALNALSKHCKVWLGVPEGYCLSKLYTAGTVFHRFEDLETALTNEMI